VADDRVLHQPPTVRTCRSRTSQHVT
jgi:hypothetical protein